MKLIDDIMNRINEHPGTLSSNILARGLASACSEAYGVSLLEVSAYLDSDGKKLVHELSTITLKDDYDNDDEARALKWLIDEGIIEGANR